MATARRLLQIARAHVGERYVLGAKVPKGNPEWRGPWDCAEFASWCVYQATKTLYGCRPRRGNPDEVDAYTGWWAEDAEKLGKKVAIGVAAATPGAFLLRAPEGGVTGHIVISQGEGNTIEAHSSKRGVIEGKADGRRWTTGVLVPGITLASAPPAREPPRRPGLVLRVKTPFMTGEIVREVQRRLTKLGFHSGPVDGIYGGQTAAAVEAFQMDRRMLVDGEVGSATAKALGVKWYG